jgi:hypothetical protein
MNFLKTLLNSFTKKVDDTSDVGDLNKVDVVKVVRTAILVSLASGLTYLVTNINPEVLGVYGILLVPVATAILDMLNKYIKGNK